MAARLALLSITNNRTRGCAIYEPGINTSRRLQPWTNERTFELVNQYQNVKTEDHRQACNFLPPPHDRVRFPETAARDCFSRLFHPGVTSIGISPARKLRLDWEWCCFGGGSWLVIVNEMQKMTVNIHGSNINFLFINRKFSWTRIITCYFTSLQSFFSANYLTPVVFNLLLFSRVYSLEKKFETIDLVKRLSRHATMKNAIVLLTRYYNQLFSQLSHELFNI